MIDIWSELCLFFNTLMNVETTTTVGGDADDDEFIGDQESNNHFLYPQLHLYYKTLKSFYKEYNKEKEMSYV